MIYLAIVGFTVLGFLLPEFLIHLGGGGSISPLPQNLISALAAGLISTGLLLGG